MKKRIVDHLMMPKPSKKARWKKLDLVPRLLCILLALLIWLLVVNTKKEPASAENPPAETAMADIFYE